MDTRRVILYAALAFVLYSLWTNWQIDYPQSPVPTEQATQVYTSGNILPGGIHSSTGSTSPEEKTTAPRPQASGQLVHVRTDVFDLDIDTTNGDIVNAQLLGYPVSVSEPNKPITILSNSYGQRYVANSGLFIETGGKLTDLPINFVVNQTSYTLQSGENTLQVQLEGETSSGIKLIKKFTFTRDSYLIKMDYALKNTSDQPWQGFMNTQLLRESPLSDKSSMFQVGSYTGASYSIPGEHKYKKISFKDMGKQNLNAEASGGWVAMQQHYFLSSWIPDNTSKNVIYTRTQNENYTIGMVSPAIQLAPGETANMGAKLYVGPENTKVLESIAPGLELTVDYGWLWFLSTLLFSLMKVIYSIVGNWGWAIVLVTVLIKLAFFRLSASSYKSMAGMRKLQPKLQALRERYGDDRAKMTQATMELYRQEKVKPLGGCLPILVQIPVFIALYWVLIESVELRQAPFILWIKDLSAPDPFHVLPVIMGITMLVQQRLNPAPPDPMQAKVMMFLPVVFTALFWNFPAGLVLYWIVNNTLSIAQQWYITRKYDESQNNNKTNSKKFVAANK